MLSCAFLSITLPNYQAELVEAARRELRRRYPVAATPPQEPQQFIATEYDQQAPRWPVSWRWLGWAFGTTVAGTTRPRLLQRRSSPRLRSKRLLRPRPCPPSIPSSAWSKP